MRTLAAEFLRRHWPSGDIPVDIEAIVDVRLSIDIIPTPYLYSAFGIDGFLSANGREIWVDESVALHPSLHRYRFTLAHELAHLLLHNGLLSVATYRDAQEWLDFQDSMPEDSRIWYERQANWFAGLVLAPPEPLADLVEGAHRQFREAGAAADFALDLSTNEHRDIVAEWIGRRMEVSGEVIRIRGEYDGHW